MWIYSYEYIHLILSYRAGNTIQPLLVATARSVVVNLVIPGVPMRLITLFVVIAGKLSNKRRIQSKSSLVFSKEIEQVSVFGLKEISDRLKLVECFQ